MNQMYLFVDPACVKALGEDVMENVDTFCDLDDTLRSYDEV